MPITNVGPLIAALTFGICIGFLRDNFHPANPANPYADYDISKLYEFLAKHGVAKSLDTSCLYSNLGVALLGQALANRADTSYATLLERTVTVPLAASATSQCAMASHASPSIAWIRLPARGSLKKSAPHVGEAASTKLSSRSLESISAARTNSGRWRSASL